MGKTTNVDLSEYGIGEPVIIGGMPYKHYLNFVKRARENPEDLEANCEMLALAIKEAPFPHATKDDLMEQDVEVIIELTMAYKERIAPLLERMEKQMHTGSAKPS